MTPEVKICGLNDPGIASLAMALGADFGGIIGYPRSPRFVDGPARAAVLGRIPPGRRVYVDAEPGPERIAVALREGFDFFQVHFDPGNWPIVGERLEGISPERLWLAPRLRDETDFDPAWLGLASAILLDGYSDDRFGGTGKRVDPALFRTLSRAHPGVTWILAGGIDGSNWRDAVERSGATRIDVNSGLETAPGVKSPALVAALLESMRPPGEKVGANSV